MDKRLKNIKFETRYFKRVLDIDDFYVKSESEKNILIKRKTKKITTNEYLSLLILFCFSFYFTLIDFQNILSILTCFLFVIFFIGIFVLGPMRDKNEYLKINFESLSIEYRVGRSTKIKKIIINDKTELHCQLDKYEVTGKPLDTHYSSSFYHKDENSKYNLFLQCNNKYKKQCETFTKAAIRYLTTISPIENIEIIDKT